MINLVHSFYTVISVVPLNARVFQTLFSANNWLCFISRCVKLYNFIISLIQGV